MKTLTINGKDFIWDDALPYYDFYLNGKIPRLADVHFDVVLEMIAAGRIDEIAVDLIVLDRWIRDAPRKRFYREAILRGFARSSGEYFFENRDDGPKIIDGLENTGKLMRRILEEFLPDLAEWCKQHHHPAVEFYIDPTPDGYVISDAPTSEMQTVCRPLKANVPEAPPGAVLTRCQYCNAECWKLALEPDPLPANFKAACTECALKRGHHQREMDAKLAEKT